MLEEVRGNGKIRCLFQGIKKKQQTNPKNNAFPQVRYLTTFQLKTWQEMYFPADSNASV